MPVAKEGRKGEEDEEEDEEEEVVVVKQQGDSCDGRMNDLQVQRSAGESGRNYRTSGTKRRNNDATARQSDGTMTRWNERATTGTKRGANVYTFGFFCCIMVSFCFLMFIGMG